MKKVLMILVITGKIVEAEYKLNLGGSLGFMTRYIDINKDILEYPKGISYIIELSTVGKLGEDDIGGILNFSYDKLNKTDIESVYISYERPSLKLEGGDVLLDISDFTIKNNIARGIKGNLLNKNAIFAFGILREKIEPSPITAGQYRQYLGLVSKDGVFKNNSWRITYLQAEDDLSSSRLRINPIENKVLGGSLFIPLGKIFSFKSLLSFSEYNPNKRSKENVKKDKAFEGGFSLNFASFSGEGLYSYIEPNFYTVGNLGLQHDYCGFKFNIQHRPKDRPTIGELGIQIYKNNIDKREASTKKTTVFNIKEEITPKLFPDLSIGYKRREEKENKKPLEIGNEISLRISSRIKDIDIQANYGRSSCDNKKHDEYDLRTSSYSLNTYGKITKKISLLSSTSFITSKRKDIKQDLSTYLLSLSFYPKESLCFVPSYDYSKTKEKNNIILENRNISFLLKWYLSTKYEIEMEYKNVETKDYKGDSFGIKIISLF